MFRYSCATGYLIFPYNKEGIYIRERTIADEKNENKVIELGLPIPQNETDFDSFSEKMFEMEAEFIDQLG